jgi:hypothetical protein
MLQFTQGTVGILNYYLGTNYIDSEELSTGEQ